MSSGAPGSLVDCGKFSESNLPAINSNSDFKSQILNLDPKSKRTLPATEAGFLGDNKSQ